MTPALERTKERPTPSPAIWLTVGVLAAAGLGLSDYVLLRFLGSRPDSKSLIYALGVNVVWGTVAALVLTVGILAWRSGKPGRLAVLLGLFGLSWWLNAPLFDGDWIKSQSWMPVARFAAILIIGLLTALTFPIISHLMRRGWTRWLLLIPGCLALHAILGVANIGWGPFARISGPAYASFKLEISLLAWAAAAIGLGALSTGLRPPRKAVAIAGLAILVIGFGAAIGSRRLESIHRVRAEIKNEPFAATSRFMDLVEGHALNRLQPLPEIRFTLDGVELKGLDQVETSRIQSELDRLAPGRKDFNVIWIAIDSLRADHLGCYGYERQTSPNIDRLAARSVRFERNTTPSPASNMAYSATLNGIAARISPACYRYYDLKPPAPQGFSIPDVLRQSGRFTMGITAFWKNVQNRPDFATMSLGFDEFNKDGHNEELDAARITDLALTSIDAARKETRPFFCFLHYIDPHAPYDFHPEYDFDGDRTAIGAYDSEIAFADHHVGRLLNYLDETGLADRTIIALFADHGESFGEHNVWRHGTSLFEQQAHVPLLIHVPGVPARSVEQRTSLMDLGPTTISLLARKDPFPRVGRDLTSLMVDQSMNWQNYSYAERPNSPHDSFRSRERAIWFDDLKMVWDPPNGTYQVFDLAKDPDEQNNIFDPSDNRQGTLVAWMNRIDERIDAFWGQSSPQNEATLEAEPEVDEFKLAFAAAVTALESSATIPEVLAAVDGVAELMKSSELSFSAERQGRVGQELVERLRLRTEVLLPAAMKDPKTRDMLARFLVFANHVDSIALLKEVRENTGNTFIRQLVNFYLAEHGDPSAREGLEAYFEVADPYAKFLTAQFLTKIGSSRGREVLRAALWGDGTYDGVRAAIALAQLDDTETMLDFLLSPSRVWADKTVQVALLDSALRRKDSIGRAAILYLANAGDEDVAENARATFHEQFPGVSDAALNKTYAAIFQGCESIRYASWKNAIEAFKGLSEEEAAIVGPYWLTLIRAAQIEDDQAAAKEFLDQLRACAQENPELSPFLTRYEKANRRSGIRLPEKSGISAAHLGVETSEKNAPGHPILVTVDITNESEDFVIGGGSRNSLFLAMGWRKAEGGHLAWRQARPLPFAGLMPGETQRLMIWARVPKEKNVVDADVVLIRGLPERSPAILTPIPRPNRDEEK